MLRIGDKVVIANKGKPVEYENACGVLIDMKWNLGLVKFTDGHIDWYELKVIHKV